MRKRWFKVVVIVVLILLPVGIWWFNQDIVQPLSRRITNYPEKITIAAGSPGGRYHKVSEALQREIQVKLGVEVELLETDGSLDNLLRLQAREADFALYQPGTLEVLKKHDPNVVKAAAEARELESATEGAENVAFVANLYLQPAHLIVRRHAEIKQPGDLGRRPDGKRRPVSVGLQQSGDYAMTLLLLEHFGLTKESVDKKHLRYPAVKKGFKERSLDAAFNTVGSPAPVLELFKTGKCDILEIPHTKALVRKYAFLSEHTIPTGLYHSHPPAKPAKKVKTVALQAQLLTRKGLSPHFIQDVTRIVLKKHFARKNDLHELLEGGKDFAKAKPEFDIHEGAQSVYDPEFDIHLIETGEATYSLAVSTVIAVFFGVRWLRKRRARTKEHKLDRYIRSLLDIEERQVDLDAGTEGNDVPRLQKLLDEVTFLRQGALREFSAHELNEDRGTDCFIEMCHDLSNKINAKISRQRLDTVMHRLIEATQGGAASGQEHSATASDVEDPRL